MFDMKCQILLDLRTFTPFNEKSSDHFKDLLKLKLLTIVYINPTSSSEGVTNLMFNTLFMQSCVCKVVCYSS